MLLLYLDFFHCFIWLKFELLKQIFISLIAYKNRRSKLLSYLRSRILVFILLPFFVFFCMIWRKSRVMEAQILSWHKSKPNTFLNNDTHSKMKYTFGWRKSIVTCHVYMYYIYNRDTTHIQLCVFVFNFYK